MDPKRLIAEALCIAVGILTTLGSATSEAAGRCPDVMDPYLPPGTIRLLDLGYPELSHVSTEQRPGETLVTGLLAAPDGRLEADTPEFELCRKAGARCRQFSAMLPDGNVVNGKFRFSVRVQGTERWLALSVPRPIVVRGPNNTLVRTGARAGEYEEFHGFSIEPFFATVNCAVNCREATRWQVRLWRSEPVEFRISIPNRKCPDFQDGEEQAD
ncbi:MAG TPA: hypothetical protein VJ724_01125 [Tahibacter sp.]|nr:hypothetical protein [Tahibacter sp.]